MDFQRSEQLEKGHVVQFNIILIQGILWKLLKDH